MMESNQTAKKAVDLARELYENGFTVIPCNGKVPAINWAKHQKGMSDDMAESLLDNPRYQDTNWGILTNVVTVVDCDSEESLEWCLKHLTQPAARVNTAQGAHLYYRTDAALELRNSVDKENKIDLRGDGGFCVGPQSVHSSGVIYTMEIAEGYDLDWRDWPTLTEADVNAISNKGTFSFDVNSTHVMHGGRNDALAREAGTLTRSGMAYQDVVQSLLEYNETFCRPPLERREVLTVADSIRKTDSRNNAQAVQAEVQMKEARVEDAKRRIQPMVLKVGDASELPKLRMVGRGYARKTVSIINAAGGSGKSLLTLNDAAAMASGMSFMGFEDKPRRVLMASLEDDVDEVKRRLAAAMLLHGFNDDDLNSNLHLLPDDSRFKVAALAGDKAIVTEDLAELEAYIEEQRIDIVIIDPWIKANEGLDENSNPQMDKAITELALMSKRQDIACVVVHHVNKAAGSGSQGANDSRGASSVIDAVRFAQKLSRMTEDQAKKYRGIEDRFSFVELSNTKANYQPPGEHGQWFEMVSVDLPNGESRGAIRPVMLEVAGDFDEVTAEMAQAANHAAGLKNYKYGKNIKAGDKDGVKNLVIRICGLAADDSARAWRIAQKWVGDGVFKLIEDMDGHRNSRLVVTSGDAYSHADEVMRHA